MMVQLRGQFLLILVIPLIQLQVLGIFVLFGVVHAANFHFHLLKAQFPERRYRDHYSLLTCDDQENLDEFT
jgi:hypothetical protein